MKKKKYKALMLDLDGTTIPNKLDGMPSKKVTEAIAKAKKLLKVGVVTARPHLWTMHIVNHLKLTSACIVDNGAQIIDPKSNIVLWEKPFVREDVKEIFKIAKKYKCEIEYSDGDSHPLTNVEETPNKIFNVFFGRLDEYQMENLIKNLSLIPTISIHKVPSWRGGTPSLIINHAEATKQHGIFEVAKLLEIETHDIIGVGDGYNDFPLLMACGLKIAMGNAVEDLKQIADYVAPSVEEDGVADVIERFVLNA